MQSRNAGRIRECFVFCVFLCILVTSGCLARRYRRTYYHPPPKSGYLCIPEGTTFSVRMNDTLDSGTVDSPRNVSGDRFTATLVGDVYAQGRIALPRGTILNGVVTEVRHIINRTSMKLVFTSARLPDGRTVPLHAVPKTGSKIDMSEVKEKIKKGAKELLVEKGIDAVTGGVLAPFWVVKKVAKGYEFVTKEERMVVPKGAILEVELKSPAYVPQT